jgi:hypothetical protein
VGRVFEVPDLADPKFFSKNVQTFNLLMKNIYEEIASNKKTNLKIDVTKILYEEPA